MLYAVLCRQLQVQQIMQTLQQQEAFTKLSAAEQQQVAFGLLLQPHTLPVTSIAASVAPPVSAIAAATAAAVQRSAAHVTHSSTDTVNTSR